VTWDWTGQWLTETTCLNPISGLVLAINWQDFRMEGNKYHTIPLSLTTNFLTRKQHLSLGNKKQGTKRRYTIWM
jgi:hypothetical protein